jgi:tripartite-type tricarboxylate transporter receptor subunit TctC
MVIYSAGAGQQALDRLGDDDRNANGLFTRIFLREMSKPGIPVDRVLRGVREEVVRLAKSVGHEQVPALYDQALGEFYFRPGAVPAAPLAAPAAVDPAALELALWDSVKDSGQAAELNAYLEQYPQGRFAAVARSRLGQLAARPPAKTAPEPIVAPARPLAPVPAAVPSAAPQAAAVAVPVAGFPGRPLRLIVPFAPGGSADILARSLAGPLGQRLGQPVVVDNQPGAGGLIGAQAAAGSVADGHTLLLGNSAAIVIGPQLQPGTTVDPLRDLLAVAAVAHAPLLLAVPAASPHASPRALVDAARSKAGGLLYATSGPGSSSHLASVAFLAAAGVSATHVPYRGMAPALTDLLAGQVDFAFVDPAAALAQVRAGKLRLLAVSGRRRLADRPDLPTLAESGIGGAEMEVWHGIFVPAGTPGGIVAYLAAEIRRVLEQADFGQRLQQLAMSAGHPGTADFASYIREDASRTARWLRAGKIGGE